RAALVIIVDREVVAYDAARARPIDHFRRGDVLEDVVFDQHIARIEPSDAVALAHRVLGHVKIAVPHCDLRRLRDLHVAPGAVDAAHTFDEAAQAIEDLDTAVAG